MPQSRRLTNDQGERLQLKSRLNEKLKGALAPPAYSAAEPQVMLLPKGFEEMSDEVLSFTLIHNPELQHSAETAALAVNMVKGAIPRDVNVRFQQIELANPVPVPEMVQEAPLKRKPSTVAPGFARTKDSTLTKVLEDDAKKAQFKQALADKLEHSLSEPVTVKQTSTRTLLLPSNFEQLSEADLHFALVNLRELKHSSDSALLAIDVLNGRKPAKGVRLEVTNFKYEAPNLTPKLRPSQRQTVARARDAAVFGTHVPRLPENYQSLSEADLGFQLLHTADFRYTPEAVADILDVLFSRREALPQPKNTQPGPFTAAPEPFTGTVLKLPSNYKELSSPELHVALEYLPELQHTPESAFLTMQILNGRELPRNTSLQTVPDVIAPKQDPTPATHKRNVKPAEPRARDASIFGANPPTLPANYRELPETELAFVLTRTTEFGYTQEAALDILDVLFSRRDSLPQPKATKPAEQQPSLVPEFSTILKLPSNYKDLAASELHSALTAIPELEHTEETALLTMQILGGWERPANTTLQAIDVTAEKSQPSAGAPKRNIKDPVRARDASIFGVQVPALPENYRELSEGELGFILRNSQAFQYTPEAAANIVDVLFGRRDSLPQAKVAPATPDAPLLASAETTLLVPANYQDFSAVDLHTILTSIPEFGHTDASAALTLSLLSGASVPHGVEVRATEQRVEAVRTPEPVRVVEKPKTSWVLT